MSSLPASPAGRRTDPTLLRFVLALVVIVVAGYAGLGLVSRSGLRSWTTRPGATPLPVACNLVATREVTLLFGRTATPAKFGPTRASSICKWAAGTGLDSEMHGFTQTLVVAVFDNADRYVVDGYLLPKLADLPGLGDRAKLLGARQPEDLAAFAWVDVVKGGRTISFNYGVTWNRRAAHPDAAQVRARAVSLARVMASRA
jgi:hypothetical protein